MIRVLLLLVMTLFVIEYNSVAYDDPRVEIYKNDFEHDTMRKTDSITIELVDTLYPSRPEIIGYCYYDEHLIKIRHDFWVFATPLSRKIVVYHELGHCLIGRSHRNDTFPDNCARSLMNSNLPALECLNKHYDDYIQELITGR